MEKLLSVFEKSREINILAEKIKNNENVGVKNTLLSYLAFVSAAIFKKLKRNFFIIISNHEDAAYFYNDLQNILPEEKVFFFPSSLKHSLVTKTPKISGPNVMMRSEVMRHIANEHKDLIIVSYPQAVSETVLKKDKLKSREFTIKTGDEIDSEFLEEWLLEEGFKKVNFVYEPGQFARRGNIVDIFSFSADNPFRIDFFGDEVEKIKVFNIQTQRSIKEVKQINILPNIVNEPEKENVNILQNIDNQTVVWLYQPKITLDIIKEIYRKKREIKILDGINEIKVSFTDPEQFHKLLETFVLVSVSNEEFFEPKAVFEPRLKPQPLFGKNFLMLAEEMKRLQEQGFKVFVLSKSQKQIERLKEIFRSEDVNNPVDFQAIEGIVKDGFTDKLHKIAVFTEHQIFGRFHRYYLKDFSFEKSKSSLLLKEINDLKPGDYVVHQDFGIGIFRGLTTIENNGKKLEVIKIDYKGNDVLYVNVHSLYKISKYKSAEGEPPVIHSLSGTAWKRTKARAKARVKDIAEKLIKLYAKRMSSKGFAFSPDNYLMEALEASFMFDETPDQAEAIEAVKRDMEKPVPMDRLVCGDVGFGKTEVAVRAAFKAVLDGKQVAILCPTTVLTFQHYKTFKERLKDFPVDIDFISRMKSSKQQKETLKRLEEGKIDIIIGTHRLLSKDVKFKDLGLLIIDEEQRFGVAAKEKLREMRVNVDTLTLTATPIPRTLEFSLMGVRDLSIINTAPPNRRPIVTELHTFNTDLIKNAIEYELQREGQVFFVQNDISSLENIQILINKLIPGVRTAIAHGQMKPADLEKIMTDFIEGKYDVLITTTIIENGLDIPNANTIIINNAHKFGLSQLHQLRGRVGRSDRQAFCYLLAPPFHTLNNNAKRRLQTIEMFTEIGSGFNIALQDLDIRGAGTLLGAEQSGFINNIGVETFKNILKEALYELKIEELKKSIKDRKQPHTKNVLYVNDCQVSTDLDAKIPDFYIQDVAERLRIYKKINAATNEKDLKEILEELKDRFGEPPRQVLQLLEIVRLRKLAVKIAIEKIILKDGKMFAYFISDESSPFYDSKLFKEGILQYLAHTRKVELRYKNNKVYLFVNKVFSVSQAKKIIAEIVEKTQIFNDGKSA